MGFGLKGRWQLLPFLAGLWVLFMAAMGLIGWKLGNFDGGVVRWIGGCFGFLQLSIGLFMDQCASLCVCVCVCLIQFKFAVIVDMLVVLCCEA